MTQSPLSVNAFVSRIHDKTRFVYRMKRLNPRVIVATVDSDNDIPMIEAMRYELPNTRVIGRVVVEKVDGEYHLKPSAPGDTREWVASPTDFMNRWGRIGKRGGSLYALNEPGTGYDTAKADQVERVERLVKWTVQTAQMGTLNDTSLCLLNLGTGHPKLVNDEWDSIFDPILKLPPGTWDRHSLGLHEYLPKQGRILRLQGLLKRCKTLGVASPKIVITEAGYDRDVNSTEPDTYRGYKRRGISGEAFFNDMRNLVEVDYRPYIDDGTLLGVCIFTYGNSGGWDDFDIEEDQGFWDAAERWQYAPGTSKPPVVVTPEPEQPVEEEKPAPVNPYAKLIAALRDVADALEELGVQAAV